MYTIIKRLDGQYECQGKLQDGMQYWSHSSRIDAIQSMIKFARVMNHIYITEKDITFIEEQSTNLICTQEERDILNKIQNGTVVILAHNDYRLKYNLTEQEYELIVKIREGDAIVRSKK